MPTISIITPWVNHTQDLLPDYAAATEGAQIITVDNGSDDLNAAALKAYTTPRGWYIRNDENAGFAAANNQGYAKAEGDIIIFLNSDIVGHPSWLYAVAEDVRNGALYGPSLQAQLIAGTHIPYLEGWCIAATRATWDRLQGPWDAESYPGPYWEDNDLCVRAIEAGIALVQTQWPIQHKGGRTAGPLLQHAESFERNRGMFAWRAMSLAERLREQPMTSAKQAYQAYAQQQNDIQHHLPLLFSLARGNVLELGTRTGVSTAALLAGVEAHGGHVWSVDIDPACEAVAKGHEKWTFTAGDSTAAGLVDHLAPGIVFDMALIDTLHTRAHVARELDLWHHRIAPGGTICVHDTETFPGVRAAIAEFCRQKKWLVTYVLPSNGMAVIEVPR